MLRKTSSRSFTIQGSRKCLLDNDELGKEQNLKSYISSMLDVFRIVVEEPVLDSFASSKGKGDTAAESKNVEEAKINNLVDQEETEAQRESYCDIEEYNDSSSAYLYNDYTGETIYIDMSIGKEIVFVESQLNALFNKLGMQEENSVDLTSGIENKESGKTENINLLVELLEKKLELLDQCKINRKYSYWSALYSEDGTEYVDPYQFLNLFYLGINSDKLRNKNAIISNYLENFGIKAPFPNKEDNKKTPPERNSAATTITNFLRLAIARNHALRKVSEVYVKYLDSSTGLFYYYNLITGDIQHHKPVVLGLCYDIYVTWQEREENDYLDSNPCNQIDSKGISEDEKTSFIQESKLMEEAEEKTTIHDANAETSERKDSIQNENKDKDNEGEEEAPDPKFFRKKSLVIKKMTSLEGRLQYWKEKHLQAGPFYERSGHFREARRVRQNFFLFPKAFDGRPIVKRLEDVNEKEIQVSQRSKEKGKKLKDYSQAEKKALEKTRIVLENGYEREEVEVDAYLLTRSIARKKGSLGLLRLFRTYHTKEVRLQIYTTLAQYDYPPNEDGSPSFETLDLLQTCLAEMHPPLNDYMVTVLSALQALLGHYCNRGLFIRLNGLEALLKLLRLVKEEQITINIGCKQETVSHLPEERIIIGEYLLRIIGLLAQDEGNRLLVCECTAQAVLKCMKHLKDHLAPLVAGYICFYNYVFLNEECHKVIHDLMLRRDLEKLVGHFDSDKSFMTIVKRTFRALDEDGWRGGFG